MGTQAYWFSAKWRYRVEGEFGWVYADTLADIKADTELGDPVEVQKRTGRKSEGYVYEHHSNLNGDPS